MILLHLRDETRNTRLATDETKNKTDKTKQKNPSQSKPWEGTKKNKLENGELGSESNFKVNTKLICNTQYLLSLDRGATIPSLMV